ncbi:hypothetical protein M3152_11865 [Sporosarcina luteola]|uniref:hypothetical protein n=1 Tax=Sporosarcina luteola TaxID=582850 RepID=UPI00203F797F|nr:hypothetical protein [Sporosarcina luteola]MCM3638396.1 hypothetical protein [Sporosarcina luteola]
MNLNHDFPSNVVTVSHCRGRILRGSEEKNEEILKMWVGVYGYQAVCSQVQAVIVEFQAVGTQLQAVITPVQAVPLQLQASAAYFRRLTGVFSWQKFCNHEK